MQLLNMAADMTTGWTEGNTLARISTLQSGKGKNPLWRKFTTSRVEYTILTQRWSYDDDQRPDVSLPEAAVYYFVLSGILCYQILC